MQVSFVCALAAILFFFQRGETFGANPRYRFRLDTSYRSIIDGVEGVSVHYSGNKGFLGTGIGKRGEKVALSNVSVKLCDTITVLTGPSASGMYARYIYIMCYTVQPSY